MNKLCLVIVFLLFLDLTGGVLQAQRFYLPKRQPRHSIGLDILSPFRRKDQSILTFNYRVHHHSMPAGQWLRFGLMGSINANQMGQQAWRTDSLNNLIDAVNPKYFYHRWRLGFQVGYEQTLELNSLLSFYLGFDVGYLYSQIKGRQVTEWNTVYSSDHFQAHAWMLAPFLGLEISLYAGIQCRVGLALNVNYQRSKQTFFRDQSAPQERTLKTFQCTPIPQIVISKTF